MDIREYAEYNESEIIRLYDSVGWRAYTEDKKALEQGYRNSLLILAAYEKGELLGIIRTVGDGYTAVLIQDIIVFPDKQRRGVGTALVKAVLERFKTVRQILLMTDDTQKTAAFYRSLGFTEMSENGCIGFIKQR